jgi:hypothetical protein
MTELLTRVADRQFCGMSFMDLPISFADRSNLRSVSPQRKDQPSNKHSSSEWQHDIRAMPGYVHRGMSVLTAGTINSKHRRCTESV